jgi:ribonuclease D
LFDTQVAQRILYESKGNVKTTKDSSISLKDLLLKYFKVVKDDKSEIKNEMTCNKYYWGTRPLTKTMMKYATEDVLFLEKLYNLFKNSLNKELLNRVFLESQQSISYSYINLNIEKYNRRTLANTIDLDNGEVKKTKLSGMIK